MFTLCKARRTSAFLMKTNFLSYVLNIIISYIITQNIRKSVSFQNHRTTKTQELTKMYSYPNKWSGTSMYLFFFDRGLTPFSTINMYQSYSGDQFYYLRKRKYPHSCAIQGMNPYVKYQISCQTALVSIGFNILLSMFSRYCKFQ